MNSEVQTPNDWVRAATLAHKLLSQTISDEELDALLEQAATPPEAVSEAA